MFIFAQTRNLWVQSAGVVTEEYASRSKGPFIVGALRDVRERYVEYALWSYDDAARQLLRGPFGDTAP